MSTASSSPPTAEALWAAPWWRPARGQNWVFGYLIVVHVLAIVGFVLYPWPGVTVFLTALALGCFGALGTTVVYHRSLAHRAVKLNPIVEQALIFGAVFSGSGVPRVWVSNHRYHHAKSDTIEDVSSPHPGGFWWAHVRWLYQIEDRSPERWSPDLRGWRYRIWTYLQTPLVAIALVWGLSLGWAGLFWIGAIRMAYCLHQQCLVNSLLHLGKRTEPGSDSSLNLGWLGPLQLTAWGENWHRNHHSDASSARFGRSWRQMDIGWYTIRMLERLGLARDVRRVRPEALPVVAPVVPEVGPLREALDAAVRDVQDAVDRMTGPEPSSAP